MARTISEYKPGIPAREWEVVEDFVRSAVADCDAKTRYSVRDLMTACTLHVHWCWRTAGLPLDRAVVFRRDVIAEYIARGCPQLTPPSAGNRRSQLLRMSELLLPPEDRTTPLAALSPANPLAPYTESELVALRSWATGQTTEYGREQAHLLLALGLGAGLSTAEILAVRACHVYADRDGVLVDVVGDRRPRTVPVLAAWEQSLVDYAAVGRLDRQQFVFRPKRNTSGFNMVGNFVTRSQPGRVKPTAQRMRVTWLVTHLAAGTPVKALVVAAGVDSLEALTRYLRYVPDVDPAEFRAMFRDATTGGAGTR